MHNLFFRFLQILSVYFCAFPTTANADDSFHILRDELLNEQQRPFLLSGRPVPRDSGAWRQDYGRSILKYDTAADCIDEIEPGSSEVDLARVNWREIRGRNSFDVCAFRIVTSLASRDDVLAWMRSQEFEIIAFTREGDRAADLNGRDVYLLIGQWTMEQYRDRRPSLLSTLGIELVQRVNLTIAYTETGEISAVIFNQNTK